MNQMTLPYTDTGFEIRAPDRLRTGSPPPLHYHQCPCPMGIRYGPRLISITFCLQCYSETRAFTMLIYKDILSEVARPYILLKGVPFCIYGYIITQSVGYTDLMLVQCWTTVCDAGPTLIRHRVSVSFLLGNVEEQMSAP